MNATATARYDIHSANHDNFDPADYRFIGAIDTDTSPFRADDSRGRKAIKMMEDEGFPYAQVHPHGQCDHCGQGLRYVAVMFHHPSAALIQVGLTCLGNRFASTAAEVKRMMAEAAKAREAHKLLDGFLAACAENQDLAYATYAWNIEAAAPEGADIWGVGVLADIARKARQYGGGVSAKQLAFVSRILTQLDERFTKQERINAERAAVKAEAGPAPEGRVAVEGEIVKIKKVEGDWGTRIVITVKLDNGAMINGTAARAIAEDVTLGRRAAFTATFERKADDETFAWFNRPIKAVIR